MKTSTVFESNEDWTFLNVSTQDYTHGFHLYPARMHPEIAKRIITKYAQDTKKVVFDPFMGSGGVLVEGILHGNNSIGIDVNPFAVLLSKVKTTPLNSEKLNKIYEEIIGKSKGDYTIKQYHEETKPTSGSLNLEFWYKPNVIKKLQILKYHIFNIEDKKVRDFFKICFSLASRKASYQRNSIYKIYRINKEDMQGFNLDVFQIFENVCKKNIKKMVDFTKAMKSSKAKAFPILGDTRKIEEAFQKVDSDILDDGKVHLVVTSPPYGDHRTTVAYGQFSKHPGIWLELPQKQLFEVDTVGIGGTRKIKFEELTSALLAKIIKQVKRNDQEISKQKKLYRADDVYAYFHDLDKCLGQTSKILKQGDSHLCFVVANRTVRRVTIPTDEILVELGKKYGFKHEKTIYRTIANKAMSLKNAPENITNQAGKTMTRESVVILKY